MQLELRLLALRGQRRLGERIELLDRGARDAEDLAAAAAQGNPGLERRDALRAQQINEARRKISG